MIAFNRAVYLDESIRYMQDVMENGKLSGDGKYTRLCSEWMEKRFEVKKVLLTTSGTSALEMAALLLDIKEGDEVIMPSYTFVSTANAFVLRGAKCVFVDIRPDTMNIDEKLIENAINDKTKAIVVVHYAGVSCKMDTIMDIAHRHGIAVVEDAAQGVMAKYNGKYLGTIGDLGCYSFHDTKNYTMGEGGALLINNPKYIERAEILREKGTDRTKFFRGEVDKYSWVDVGSSYLPGEMNAAYLYPQLLMADEINLNRRRTWDIYYSQLKELEDNGVIELPVIPGECEHNAHMFWIKLHDLKQRGKYIEYMKGKNNIGCVFHYVPLHSSQAGKLYCRMKGEDRYTTSESERLVRLPLYYNMDDNDIFTVIKMTKSWLKEN